MTKKDTRFYRALYDTAHGAGIEAGRNCQPEPMVVQELANPLDNRTVVQEWTINDGVCGFAEIIIGDARQSFARWLKSSGLARTSYGGGVYVWVHQFNQSLARKEAYARAFARVLKEAGIRRVYVQSRMD